MSDEFVLTSPGEESIGPRLARHREARGLTLATAAAKLHCEESILRALETERFGEIGARVFVQGHLRRYADLIGAPADELLAEWARRSASGAQPDLTQVPRAPVRAVDPQVWARRIGSAAAALVIAVVAWWILQGGGVPKSAGTDPVKAPTLAAAAPVVPMPAPVIPAPAEPTASEAAPAPTGVDAAPAAREIPAAVNATGPALALIAGESDSWVEIYDANGRRLYFNMLRRGGRATVRGPAPLRVLVGRADTTAFEIDGRSVSIPPTIMREGTAHFVVEKDLRLVRYVKPVAPPASSTMSTP
ncbi:MAG: DUF4115 domain-containing protein [Hyphomicrobiales bacterium]|nr:DUF4115 domain-containing protein [Hyphomicrobiales bacterium]